MLPAVLLSIFCFEINTVNTFRIIWLPANVSILHYLQGITMIPLNIQFCVYWLKNTQLQFCGNYFITCSEPPTEQFLNKATSKSITIRLYISHKIYNLEKQSSWQNLSKKSLNNATTESHPCWIDIHTSPMKLTALRLKGCGCR